MRLLPRGHGGSLRRVDSAFIGQTTVKKVVIARYRVGETGPKIHGMQWSAAGRDEAVLADLWASSIATGRRRALRRFLWQMHLLITAPAVLAAILIPTGAAQLQLLAGGAVYVTLLAAIGLASQFQSGPSQTVALAILDVVALAMIVSVVPVLWYPLLPVMLAAVGIGWIESIRASALTLATAVMALAVSGAYGNVDLWWLGVTGFVILGAGLTVNALWPNIGSLSEVALALNALRVIVWEADADGTVTQAVGHVETLVGITPSQLVGRNLLDIVGTEAAAEVADHGRQLFRTGSTSMVHKLPGSNSPHMVRSSVQRRAGGRDAPLHGVTVDISEDWVAGETKRRHASIIEHMRDGLLVIGRNREDLILETVNEAGIELLGLDPQAPGDSLQRDHATLFDWLQNAATAASLEDHELRMKYEIPGHASPRWAQVHIFDLSSDALAAQMFDITEQKLREDEIQHRATHDGLTDLLNAQEFRRLLAAHLEQDVDQPWVFVIDLDEFKAVNDKHGHEAGDAVLVHIARRLRNCMKAQDALARMGGDEFVGFVHGSATGSDVEKLARRIEAACGGPIAIGNGVTVRVGASVGFARPDSGTGATAAIDLADRAMYTKKAPRSDQDPDRRTKTHS